MTKNPKDPEKLKAYHEFATKNASQPVPEFRAAARQFAARTRNAPMLEDLGSMETAAEKLPEAAACLDQARTLYTKRDDILRAVLEEASVLAKLNKTKRALDILHDTLRIISNAPASALLKKLEMELRSAKPPAPPANPRRP